MHGRPPHPQPLSRGASGDGVVPYHRPLRRRERGACLECFHGAFGAPADRPNRFEIGAYFRYAQTGHRLGEVEPMRANVGDYPERASFLGEDAPVEIGVVEQPVLHVGAGDVIDFTEPTRRDPFARFQAQRIKTNVVAHRRDQRFLLRQFDQLRRFLDVQRQWFFADHVLAGGQGAPALVIMETIGRR